MPAIGLAAIALMTAVGAYVVDVFFASYFELYPRIGGLEILWPLVVIGPLLIGLGVAIHSAIRWRERKVALALSLSTVVLYLLPILSPLLARDVLGVRLAIAYHGESAYALLAHDLRESGFRQPTVGSRVWQETHHSTVADTLDEVLERHDVARYNPGLRTVAVQRDSIELTWGSGMLGTIGVRYIDGQLPSPDFSEFRGHYRVSDRLFILWGE